MSNAAFTSIGGELRRRRESEADVRFARYIKPRGAGLHEVRAPGQVATQIVGSIARGVTFKPGAMVPVASNSAHPGEEILGRPGPGRGGQSGFPFGGQKESADDIGIRALDPLEHLAGTVNNPVTIRGYGFSSSPLTVLAPVAYNPATQGFETDSLVTVHSLAFVDSETLTALVDVSIDAEDEHPISIDPRRN